MMKRLLSFVLGALFTLIPAAAASLTVTVYNINPKGGLLHVALYNEKIWDNDKADPLTDRIVPAISPATTVTFDNIAPGTYGIKTYQDINENDKFDQDLIGIPEEPYGFSNDARPGLSEPFFDRCSFHVDGTKHNAINIHLQ